MKQLFNLDNPFLQFLARVFDMMLLNLLFLICCIPLFTIGAAAAALSKATQSIVEEKDAGVFRTFLRAFRGNFRQATLAWLALLVFFVGMGCNFLLVAAYLAGNTALVLNSILTVLVAAVLALSTYLFPLMARYENSLREHAVNAGILTVVKLPRSLAMLFLHALPLLILYFSMEVFAVTLIFWLTAGFSVVGYLCSVLLAPVFRELERPRDLPPETAA